MAGASPRILAAVQLLNPRSGESLLEIGCGTGQAIEAILERERTARITAIDRSDKALARATTVNRAGIEAGRVRIFVADIEQAPAPPGGFDRVFAIRVNSFWTRPGVALPHVIASLRPGGEFWMIYDAPAAKISEPILTSLGVFGVEDVRTELTPGAFAIVATVAG